MKEEKHIVPLKEVCLDFIVPQRDKPTAFDGNIPWCRIEDIEGRYLNGSKSGQNVTKELADQMNMHLCPKGTVISACSASIGNQAITTTDCYTNQTFIGLVVNPNLLYNVYLYYFLESQTKNLLKLGQGATIKYISKDKYKRMLIPLPPLSDQKFIVDYLDSSFAHIDELKANAEKQLNDAKALFQKALEKAMEPKEGWEEKNFGDVCDYHKEQGVYKNMKYIGMENMISGRGEILGYMNSNEVLSSSFKFNKGDVLYGRLRPYLRKVYIAEFDGCCSTEIFPIVSKIIEPGFIKYWLLTDKITNKINATSSGCRMPRGNMNEVKKFLFSYPVQKSVQQQIVTRLDSLSANIKALEENLEKTISECDALKQALLREVFE